MSVHPPFDYYTILEKFTAKTKNFRDISNNYNYRAERRVGGQRVALKGYFSNRPPPNRTGQFPGIRLSSQSLFHFYPIIFACVYVGMTMMADKNHFSIAFHHKLGPSGRLFMPLVFLFHIGQFSDVMASNFVR